MYFLKSMWNGRESWIQNQVLHIDTAKSVFKQAKIILKQRFRAKDQIKPVQIRSKYILFGF